MFCELIHTYFSSIVIEGTNTPSFFKKQLKATKSKIKRSTKQLKASKNKKNTKLSSGIAFLNI